MSCLTSGSLFPVLIDLFEGIPVISDSPICQTIIRNDLEALKDLTGDFEAKDSRGLTPLWCALLRFRKGAPNQILPIIEHLVNSRKVDLEKTHQSKSVLAFAIMIENAGLVKLLVNSGRLNVNEFMVINGKEFLPLTMAVTCKNPEIVQILLVVGADPNQSSNTFASAYDQAIQDRTFYLVELMRKYAQSFDPNEASTTGCTAGKPILFRRILLDDLEGIQFLIEKCRCNINLMVGDYTPLDCARYYGNEAIINYLVANGAKENKVLE